MLQQCLRAQSRITGLQYYYQFALIFRQNQGLNAPLFSLASSNLSKLTLYQDVQAVNQHYKMRIESQSADLISLLL